MAMQLGDEGLAEAHHLARALALGIEVRTALAAAHGQRGERVFQGLFESEELEDGQVDRRMEADAALVGADGHAVLHAVAAVDLDVAMVVDPGDPEDHDPLGLDQAVEQAVLGVLGMLGDERPQALHDFGHGLQVLGLSGIALGGTAKEFVRVLVLHFAQALSIQKSMTVSAVQNKASPLARPDSR